MGSHVVSMVPGTPELGVWCDRCATSAGIRISLNTVGDWGVRQLGEITVCTGCDMEDQDDDDA